LLCDAMKVKREIRSTTTVASVATAF